eukprot:211564-Chlamydomonas_euryale.AAC.1
MWGIVPSSVVGRGIGEGDHRHRGCYGNKRCGSGPRTSKPHLPPGPPKPDAHTHIYTRNFFYCIMDGRRGKTHVMDGGKRKR